MSQPRAQNFTALNLREQKDIVQSTLKCVGKISCKPSETSRYSVPRMWRNKVWTISSRFNEDCTITISVDKVATQPGKMQDELKECYCFIFKVFDGAGTNKDVYVQSDGIIEGPFDKSEVYCFQRNIIMKDVDTDKIKQQGFALFSFEIFYTGESTHLVSSDEGYASHYLTYVDVKAPMDTPQLRYVDYSQESADGRQFRWKERINLDITQQVVVVKHPCWGVDWSCFLNIDQNTHELWLLFGCVGDLPAMQLPRTKIELDVVFFIAPLNDAQVLLGSAAKYRTECTVPYPTERQSSAAAWMELARKDISLALSQFQLSVESGINVILQVELTRRILHVCSETDAPNEVQPSNRSVSIDNRLNFRNVVDLYVESTVTTAITQSDNPFTFYGIPFRFSIPTDITGQQLLERVWMQVAPLVHETSKAQLGTNIYPFALIVASVNSNGCKSTVNSDNNQVSIAFDEVLVVQWKQSCFDLTLLECKKDFHVTLPKPTNHLSFLIQVVARLLPLGTQPYLVDVWIEPTDSMQAIKHKLVKCFIHYKLLMVYEPPVISAFTQPGYQPPSSLQLAILLAPQPSKSFQPKLSFPSSSELLVNVLIDNTTTIDESTVADLINRHKYLIVFQTENQQVKNHTHRIAIDITLDLPRRPIIECDVLNTSTSARLKLPDNEMKLSQNLPVPLAMRKCIDTSNLGTKEEAAEVILRHDSQSTPAVTANIDTNVAKSSESEMIIATDIVKRKKKKKKKKKKQNKVADDTELNQFIYDCDGDFHSEVSNTVGSAPTYHTEVSCREIDGVDDNAFEVDDAFTCPISFEIMTDPVICMDGHSYERKAIEDWFARGKTTSPKTGAELVSQVLIPNFSLKAAIEHFRATKSLTVSSKAK